MGSFTGSVTGREDTRLRLPGWVRMVLVQRTITGLNANSLAATLGGAGTLTLTGSVNEQVVTISGAGNYQAAELSSTSAVINVRGAGDADVSANGTLDANISGAGDITYSGSPTVTQNITGSGSVTARN